MLNIITLMENMPSENKALLNKHGLSFLIEYNGHRFLFDCGSDKSFCQTHIALEFLLTILMV